MKVDEWVCTDPSNNQYRKTVKEGQIYLFREDRIINPETKETEVFEKEMNIDDYDSIEGYLKLHNAMESFGYKRMQVERMLTDGDPEDIELILECLFELSN